MRVGLRMLKPTTVRWLRSELESTSLSRAEFTCELCRRDEWRNPRSKLCAASARKGLPLLARDLGLSLPAPSRRTGGCARRSPQVVRQAFPSVQVRCSLRELGEVRLCLADTPRQRRHWSALLAAEHPLGRGPAPGCRLGYGIRAQGLDLGVLSWVAAPLRLAPRDQLQVADDPPLAGPAGLHDPGALRRSFEVDSQGGKRARKRRTVRTEVRIGTVEVQAPKERRQRGEEGIDAWLVHVRQTNAEPGEKPLDWLLTSTVGGPTESWARRIVGWYEARWGIEEFFRVLKSGMHIEDRKLRTADALKKCLVFDAVTAWQVFSLARYARDAPDTPAEEVLTSDEREVIGTLVNKQQLLPPQERGRAPPPRHPHLGGVAGAHGRIPAVQASASAGQPDPVAGLQPCGADRALPATGPQLRAGCRGAGTGCPQEFTHPCPRLGLLRPSSIDSAAMRASRLP